MFFINFYIKLFVLSTIFTNYLKSENRANFYDHWSEPPYLQFDE